MERFTLSLVLSTAITYLILNIYALVSHFIPSDFPILDLYIFIVSIVSFTILSYIFMPRLSP